MDYSVSQTVLAQMQLNRPGEQRVRPLPATVKGLTIFCDKKEVKEEIP